MRAAIYCRISKDAEDQGLGVERQEEDCRALADRLGWEVAALYVDNDTSAYDRRRPRRRYREMLEAVRAGNVDAVMAYREDRLYRRMDDLEEFIDVVNGAGAQVAVVDRGALDLTTANGRMIARVLGATAQNYSEQNAEKIRRALQQNQEKGKPNGGTRPFGYEPDKVTIRESEAAEIRDAAARALAGEPMRSIVADWNARVPTAHGGGRWTNGTVKRILTNPRVAGLLTHHGQVIGDGAWDPILDRTTWERVAAILNVAGNWHRGSKARKWLTRGLAVCGLCGTNLVTRPRGKYKGRERDPNYVCPAPKDGGCGGIGVVTTLLDEHVIQRVAMEADFREVGRRALEGRLEPGEAARLATDLQDVESRLEELGRAYGEGHLDMRGWLAAKGELDRRADGIRERLSAGAGYSDVAMAISTGQSAWDFQHAWDREQQRAFLDAAVDRVIVDPTPRRGRARFDASRVRIVYRDGTETTADSAWKAVPAYQVMSRPGTGEPPSPGQWDRFADAAS